MSVNNRINANLYRIANVNANNLPTGIKNVLTGTVPPTQPPITPVLYPAIYVNTSDKTVWYNSDGSTTWTQTASPSALPPQTGNAGRYLTTDGTNPSWSAIQAIPSVTGQTGRYLTNDGTAVSWGTIAAPAVVRLAGASFVNGVCTIDNIFSVTYRRYKVDVTVSQRQNGGQAFFVWGQLLFNGTADTSSVYQSQWLLGTGNQTPSANAMNGQANWYFTPNTIGGNPSNPWTGQMLFDTGNNDTTSRLITYTGHWGGQSAAVTTGGTYTGNGTQSIAATGLRIYGYNQTDLVGNVTVYGYA